MSTGTRDYWRNFLGGEWCDAADGRRITTEDPARGEAIANRCDCGPPGGVFTRGLERALRVAAP